MAVRPYFCIGGNDLVRSADVEFKWFAGLSVSQKRKSVASLHSEIAGRNRRPLEISTKSEVELGRRLSAFNLQLNGLPIEVIYHASKVFSGGGPYTDLLGAGPREAKHDERLKTSGHIIGYSYDGIDWPSRPQSAFYDWIYYNAVRSSLSAEDLEEFAGYDAFTDIEFNPNKSVNTQARSAALILWVYRKWGELPELTPEQFLELHRKVVTY